MRRQNSSNSSRANGRRSGLFCLLADSQAGFSIIEVVVSAVMVAAMAGAAATALIATSHFSGDQRRRSQADEIAQADQERMKGMSAKALSGYSFTNNNVGPYDGAMYTVVSTGKFLSSAGNPSCTSSGTTAAAYILITSDVTWTGNNRSHVIQKSLVTPPTGGTLLTNVKDQNNAALSGVTVNAAGPDNQTAVTDADGCVVFGAMDTGDYNVTVSKSGYVDPDGNLSPSIPSRPATVSGSGTSFPSPNPFQLGLPGAIQASFTANATSGAVTGQHAPSLSVSNAGRATPLITTPASPTTPITTTTTLFPFTSAYTVWAGACPGEQPPATPAGLRTTQIVGAGATAAPAVKEPALNVDVEYPSGTNKKPAGLKLYYSQSAGGTCSESWVPAISTAAGPNPPTNGWLASPGQPFAGSTTVGSTTYNGSYLVCASYNTPTNGLRFGMNVGVTNSNFTTATLTTVPISDTNAFTSTYISGAGACP